MADETFGGVIVDRVEPQVIVAISTRPGPPGPSGYSGYSGRSGTGGGGSGGSGTGADGASGFSGKSGFSGGIGGSGFSGYSSRSGYSGYSGVGSSGFSGYSGASGQSGPAGGQSGFSGYSGADGTFSASGFSGYSGFSSRSGFSGYSGSGFSGYSGSSGFSGFAQSGFSGFSGPGTSGFSGFSAPSGFSGFSGKSGFSGPSGFSGVGSPSGGSTGDAQFNDGAGGFAGHPSLNLGGGFIKASTNAFRIIDNADPTKVLNLNLSNLPTGTTTVLTVPGATPVAVAANPATANQFLTGITPLGIATKAQVDTTNLSGLVSYGQLDRSTVVVSETATLTIAANTKVKSTASGTLTKIQFSGGDNAQQGRRLDLDITGGPYTLNIPACRRIGETNVISTLQVFAGYNEFSWEFIQGEYILSDSVSDPSSGGGSGVSGYSGRSGYSAYSGYSGPAGAGTSGFSGFSGFAASSSGFSGYSAPQLMAFTTHNDVDWTLVLADANTGVKMASSAAHSVTVPLNASVPFPIGTQIAIEQGGAGIVNIVPDGIGGVTLQGAGTTSGQYSVVVLIKQGTDTWLVAKAGASGYSGFSGGTGAAGGSGFSGYSGGGTSGFSGFSGPGGSGFSGYSSLSGFSGRSGYSGFSGPTLLTFSTQVDTDYTLVAGDANTGVKMSSGSPHTLTVPPNSSVAFAIGTQIPVEQGSSGIVTIAAGAGVTLQGAVTTAGQFSMIVLIKQATDTWLCASGNSGYSGYSGKSGYSGYSGYSGFSAFSGFSGTGGWIKLTVSGSDVTTTGQSLVDITGLITGTLTASTLYEIRGILKAATSADTTGIKYGIGAGGTGTAAAVNVLLSGTTTAASAQTETINAPATASSSTYLQGSGSTGTIEIRGWVTTRSTGTPTISIQHLKVTSGTSTVRIGSYMEYRVA